MQDYIENRFNKVDEKLDKIDTSLDDIKNVQIAQAKDIEHHVTRTNELQDIVTPLQQNYQQAVGILKFILFIAACEGIIKIFSYLNS